MRNLLLPALALGVGVAWMLSGAASSATFLPAMDPTDYDLSQNQIMTLLRAEALKQGAPVEFVMATAEVESGFRNVKATNGASYGPLQVHVSALLSGETEADLKNVSFSIARGVSIIRHRLTRANGDSLEARTMYFCGANYTPATCSELARQRLRERWLPVAKKWGVRTRYRLSGAQWVGA